MEGPDQPLQGAEPDAARTSSKRRSSRSSTSTACSGSSPWTWPSSTATATGSAPATTALPGRQGQVPRHPARHERGVPSGRWAGGPGGGFMRMPPPGVIMPPPVQDTLQLTEAQKKQMADIQKEIDEKLEKLLTEEQRKQFKEMKDRGPGGGPGGPGGFGPPGGGFPGGPGGSGGGGRAGRGARPARRADRREQAAAEQAARGARRCKAKYLANVKTIAAGLARLEEARPGGGAVPQADREGGGDRHAQARLVRGRSSGPRTTRPRRRAVRAAPAVRVAASAAARRG